MKLPDKLIDYFGREYPRRNQWIQDVQDAEAAGDSQKVKHLKENKEDHPYQKALKEFEEAEKAYLEERKELLESYAQKDQEGDQHLEKLRVDLQQARFDQSFYEPYVGLTYDAQLAYDKAESLIRQLPRMMEDYRSDQAQLAHYQNLQVAPAEEAAYQKKLDQLKAELSEKRQKADEDLKSKEAEGIISKSALKNGLNENKLKYETDLKSAEAKSPKNSRDEYVRYYEHKLKQDKKGNEKVINEEISDLRRSTPVEVESNRPWLPYVSLLFPGLGQAIHKQWAKALVFFILGLIIYLLAVPYMLGYGNYQGDGLAGLITLAEGGARLDRSIMFLIEGIIALILAVFVILILLINFFDVKRVEDDILKGIRPANNFDFRNAVHREGFPYVVNIPAAILIAFIVLVPIFTTIFLSFTNMDPSNQSKFTWIGLDNYMMIFRGQGLAGELFWKILGWTIVWTLSATTLQIVIGFALALVTNQERIRGKGFFRTIYILPWAIPAFITILFFSIMAAPNGYITELLQNLTGQNIVIKNSTTLTRIAIILLQGWLGSSYIFLLTTGVLQSIPKDLYEAAEIDGASTWDQLRRITVPLVLFQTAPLLISQYTFNFNNYSIIALFNDGGPFNPTEYGNLAGSTDILVSYIFKLVTQNNYQAIGAAITVLISLGLMLVTFLGFNRSEAFKEG